MVKLSLALMAAAALTPARSGCRPLSARVTVERIEDARPEHALLRCAQAGGRAPFAFSWTLGDALQQVGWQVPADEPTLLVYAADARRLASGGTATCTITDGVGARASAGISLAEIAVTKILAPPGGLLTVLGSGFREVQRPGDGVWLATDAGLREADLACPRASWTATRIVACVDPALRPRELRVASGGRLAIAAFPASPR